MKAAVPEYLGSLDNANPGMRFGMCFRGWENDAWKLEAKKFAALEQAAKLTDVDKQVLNGIRSRQKAQFRALPSNGERMKLAAESTSPFMTGLGNEHPTENGFSFLNPYGLPYLPGSGVKGVVRRAAIELAEGYDGETKGWNCEAIDSLFGTPDQAGLLQFWDAIPKPNVGKLDIEVMTPHFSEYYQENGAPHDSGSPNPILFLAVPPGSEFEFYVVRKHSRLGAAVPEWQFLVREAMFYAFDWLGFGAKTAVGYGAMKRSEKEIKKEKAQKEQEKLREQQEEEARRAEEADRLKLEEEERRKAERKRMPESERLLLDATESLKQWAADEGNLTKKREAQTALGKVRERAPQWEDSEVRERAAQLQERAWEIEGQRPGMNKKQRERQAKKRAETLRHILKGE